ncbi:hypothetical protein EST38_g4807 [Candolleomyces aberdarensis]|uniref:Sodium/calcium exchanger membrane region domain-containing protein n=1 Tax=Candolleomyces aberdarensis TaxID=2316362 RepID=A0A4Q2DM26_9AGAR|nr:hypothetical protein EST38_g4807 [Candolleomyces aberdarensis]
MSIGLSYGHSRESTTVGHSNSPPGELVESPLHSPRVGEDDRHAYVSAQTTAVTDDLGRTAQPRRSSRLSDIRRRTLEMMTPSKPIGEEPTVLASIKAFLLCSKLNVLLVFIPVSWALNFALPHSFSSRDTLIFVFSFIAIIPLAKLLGFATEELSLRVGQTLAGLMNATLGNAVELIVAIIALVKCELRIVQASSVLLPAAFHFSVPELDDSTEATYILSVSHGVAIILLVIYIAYLFFQLFSHSNLYADTGDHIFKSTSYHADKKRQLARLSRKIGKANPFSKEKGAPPTAANEEGTVEEEVEIEMPCMNLWVSIGALAIVTVLVAVTAEWLVDSIKGVTESGKLSKEFVGMILLPIVGNAAEHLTAVTVSVKDKLTLSLGVAVGSSIQIALFVIPFVVTLGWILGKPLTLLFDPYESVALFLSVLTVNYVVQDGKSNWLEGFILMCMQLRTSPACHSN